MLKGTTIFSNSLPLSLNQHRQEMFCSRNIIHCPFFEDQNCPLPYELLGRCGGIKAGGLNVRSHNGKLGNKSWIVQHTEVVPIYGRVIVLTSSAFRSLNE